MNENLVTIKTAIVAGCTALGAFLGFLAVTGAKLISSAVMIYYIIVYI